MLSDYRHLVHVLCLQVQQDRCVVAVLESDMPYLYYADNGVLFKMTVNQSMVQLVADVTSAAAAVTGRLVMYIFTCSTNTATSTSI